jgi:RNA recognition motif-containing protein
MELFVGNISKLVNDIALRALFNEFGEVDAVRILKDRSTGESKGMAFVSMVSEQQAHYAMRSLAHAEFFGKRLVVTRAHGKTN